MPCIVFDMDGVLIDSERLVLRAWEIAGAEWGLTGLQDLFYRCVGTTHASTGRLFAATFGEGFDYEGFRDKVRAHYMEMTRDSIPLKPGVDTLLGWLEAEGWKVGLASSSRTANVLRTLDVTGLGRHFHAVVGGDILTVSKPQPDIYLKACAMLEADPRKAYAVEDSHNGIRSAHAAGMTAIMVPDMMPVTDEMRSLAAAILPDLGVVRDWLEAREAGA